MEYIYELFTDVIMVLPSLNGLRTVALINHENILLNIKVSCFMHACFVYSTTVVCRKKMLSAVATSHTFKPRAGMTEVMCSFCVCWGCVYLPVCPYIVVYVCAYVCINVCIYTSDRINVQTVWTSGFLTRTSGIYPGTCPRTGKNVGFAQAWETGWYE